MKRQEQWCSLLNEESRREASAHAQVYELRHSAPDGVHISDGPQGLLVRHDFKYPIEIRLGRKTEESQKLFIVRGEECSQIGAKYVLVQPEVVARDPRRGWLPLGERHPDTCFLGQEDSPELDLGADVDPDHGYVSVTADGIFISDGSETGTDVRAHPDDVLDFS